MFHQHGDDDVDEDKLRHEDEDDEVDWCDDRTDTAVDQAVVRSVTVFSQCVLK